MAQTFTGSSSNATYGHDLRPSVGGQSVSQSYNIGTEAADRIVFSFFFQDGDEPTTATNPVFHVSGVGDVAAQMIGSQAGGGSYIAWALIPTGTAATFEATSAGIIMEFVFMLYGGSTVIHDFGGDTSGANSVTGIDREIGGTVIGWMLANSEVLWTGTSPVLTQRAERVVFASNRQIEVAAVLDVGATVTNTTVTYSSAQRVLVLSLKAPTGGGATVQLNSGLHHIECGSPMGKKTNGILHPIQHGIVGERVSHTRRAA